MKLNKMNKELSADLDFGLAKLVEPQRTFETGDTSSSEIATAVRPQQSIPGMVMGTLGSTRDGKQIALSRGTQTSDVVLTSDFK